MLDRARWSVRERAVARQVRDVRPVDGPPALDALVVVSPHLDDAVFSCAQALAAHPGSTVVTVMTEVTGERRKKGSEWDRECGFKPGDDVMAVRKREDRHALDLLRAAPVWLDCVEAADEPWHAREAVTKAITGALGRLGVRRLLLPLGLVNVDHVVVSDAVLAIDLPGVERTLYLDQPYAGQQPAEVEKRLAALAERGVEVEPVQLRTDADVERKRAAVHRYPTQCRPLWPDLPLVLRPERYWRVLDPEDA